MIPFIDVDLTPTETQGALRDVLQGDFDPADDATRLGVPAGTGQLLAVVLRHQFAVVLHPIKRQVVGVFTVTPATFDVLRLERHTVPF